MRLTTRLWCAICALAVLTCTSALAEQKFKGDGTAGGLMPDFSQRQGQEIKGICSAAAAADALWYLDQHGFSGLVDHNKPNKPNEPWKDDAKDLVLGMADLIFGKDYMAGKTANGISDGVNKGITTYLKKKGFNKVGPQDRPALTLRRRDSFEAQYGWWRFYAESDATYPAFGDFSWRDDKGAFKTTKDSKDRDIRIRHAMVAGGRDTDNAKTHVTMGWEDHPADNPPYKKPPYAEGETPYFDTYDIELTGAGSDNTKRMRLPNQIANLFNRYPADFISLDAIESIENVKTKVVGGARVPVPPSYGGGGGSDGDLRYFDYQIVNTSENDFAAKQFFLQVRTPYDWSSVAVPSGWSYTPWDPRLTPEITPSPQALTDDGDYVDPEAGAWNPNYSGILFYTNNDFYAVPPGATLAGFSFATDAFHPFSDGALFSGVSSSPASLVNMSYTGSTTEYGFVAGPYLVPEPASWLLAALLLPLVSACRLL